MADTKSPAPAAPAPKPAGTPAPPPPPPAPEAARARSSKPTRSAVPVRATDIPAAQRGGDWLEDVEFLKSRPGEYFVYENVGASSVTYLRSTFGLDAKGRNTRTVDATTGQPVAKDTPGARKVIDMYVAYVPELVGQIKSKGKGTATA